MVDIRRAHAREGELLGSLHHAWRAAAIPAIPPSVHTEEETRRWFADEVLPTSEVWVGEASGRAVALMVLRDGWLDHLYVDPDWTGHGIGGRLLRLAKERRPSGLQLWAFQSNVGARRFYERHGFTPVEQTDGSGNEERASDVRYTWEP
jgi:GNAT superfamily N-acetyltransferase